MTEFQLRRLEALALVLLISVYSYVLVRIFGDINADRREKRFFNIAQRFAVAGSFGSRPETVDPINEKASGAIRRIGEAPEQRPRMGAGGVDQTPSGETGAQEASGPPNIQRPLLP